MEFYPICDETLALSTNLWYSVSGTGESPFMRVGHTIIHHINSKDDNSDRGSLVVIGGANPSECFKDCYSLDLNKLCWDKYEDSKNFETGRYEHACFQSKNGNIYIFAGADQEKNFNNLIEFNIEKKECEKVEVMSQNMPSPRTIHNGVTFKDQLLIFSGGASGKTPTNDSKIHIFNPINKKWISLTIKGEVPCNRHGHLMINYNDELIYLHGGMSEDEIFNDLWVLDLKQMSWRKIKDNGGPCARTAHGGICVGNNLYIFGGYKDGGALDDLWKYDTELNKWSQVEVFGYKPPARLDFAYCKLSFLNKVSTELANASDVINMATSAASTKDLATGSDLLVNQKIQELNLMDGKLEELNESDEEENESEIKYENKEVPEIIEAVNENPRSEIIKENNYTSNENKPVNEELIEPTTEKLPSNDSSVEKLMNFLVIHGGMDTEGNVHEDCFFINLE